MTQSMQLYEEKIDRDNDLSDPNVMTKYRMASDICNEVLTTVLKEVNAGVNVSQLCQYGDFLIMEKTSKLFNKKKVEKGIAYPTSINVNSCASGYSPAAEKSIVLQPGDLVKLELGVHIDGYIATAAHSTVIPLEPSQPVTGDRADALCAGYYAMEAAWRMIKPGTKASDVTLVINKIAESFGCVPVENYFTCPTKRFLPHVQPKIFHSLSQQDANEEEDYEFEHNTVYTVNIAMAKGSVPTTKETDILPCIMQRDVNVNYNLKLKSSRAVFNEINEKFGVFPFSISSVPSARSKLGLNELLNHGILTLQPVLFSSTNSPVAQFKFTIACLPNCTTLRLTIPQEAPYVHSEFSLDSELVKIVESERPRLVGEKTGKKSGSGAESMNID
ncbi:peptidase M24, structural domain-containing protein [Paraphysoderma sedebokerense]|nr:peptidase M24, structural domain-containing protein [Paraphysoderma sedebokerense]